MKAIFFFLLGCVCCSGVFSVNARPVLPFTDIRSDSVNKTLDTTEFQILEDPQGSLRIEQVANHPGFHHDTYFTVSCLLGQAAAP